MRDNSWAKALVNGAVFIVAYFVLAYVGVPLRIDAIDASPVWLPHGLSLAAILVLGPRFWPAITLAVIVRTLFGGLPLSAALRTMAGEWTVQSKRPFDYRPAKTAGPPLREANL